MADSPSPAPNEGDERGAAGPRWRERQRVKLQPWLRALSKLTGDERAQMRLIVLHARQRGPVYTAHLVARGELGGPVLQAALSRLPGLSELGSPVQMWAVIVLGGPLLAILMLLGTDAVLKTHLLGWEVAAVAVLTALGSAATAMVYFFALRQTRGKWWTRLRGWTSMDFVWWGALMFLLPTVAFAALTALLVRQRALPVSGVKPGDAQLAVRTFQTFAWNLADAIPLLDVTGTLHWTARLQFTTIPGGAFVLAYKVALIFPLVQLGTLAVDTFFGADDEPAAAPDAVAEQGAEAAARSTEESADEAGPPDLPGGIT
jgi:hypothetical protein